MPREKLIGEAKAIELAKIPSWTPQEGNNKPDSIFKKFAFRDFVTAFGFMTQVALVAEKVKWPSFLLKLCNQDLLLTNFFIFIYTDGPPPRVV